jgi:hypothetical protein
MYFNRRRFDGWNLNRGIDGDLLDGRRFVRRRNGRIRCLFLCGHFASDRVSCCRVRRDRFGFGRFG